MRVGTQNPDDQNDIRGDLQRKNLEELYPKIFHRKLRPLDSELLGAIPQECRRLCFFFYDLRSKVYPSVAENLNGFMTTDDLTRPLRTFEDHQIRKFTRRFVKEKWANARGPDSRKKLVGCVVGCSGAGKTTLINLLSYTNTLDLSKYVPLAAGDLTDHVTFFLGQVHLNEAITIYDLMGGTNMATEDYLVQLEELLIGDFSQHNLAPYTLKDITLEPINVFLWVISPIDSRSKLTLEVLTRLVAKGEVGVVVALTHCNHSSAEDLYKALCAIIDPIRIIRIENTFEDGESFTLELAQRSLLIQSTLIDTSLQIETDPNRELTELLPLLSKKVLRICKSHTSSVPSLTTWMLLLIVGLFLILLNREYFHFF